MVLRRTCLAALLATSALGQPHGGSSTEPFGAPVTGESAAPSTRPSPQVVHVGVYLRNVDAIDIATNAYSMQFVLWMRWRGEVDPTPSLRFTNVIDAWALTQTPAFTEPIALEDGSKYQRFTVEGRFFHKFWLGTFPLDWQKVTVEVEDGQHDASVLRYVPDTTSAVDPALVIPGWVLGEVYNETREAEYPTAFGRGTAPPRFSHYRFGLELRRPASLFFLKMLPPIALVLLCCYFVFFLRPTHVDARVGTAITALLTVVFLQLAFTDDLPYLGISVLLDQIFNFSYLVMTAILLECVLVIRTHDEATRLEELIARAPSEREATQPRIDVLRARIHRMDRTSQIAFPIVYVVGCFVITLAARGTALFGSPF